MAKVFRDMFIKVYRIYSNIPAAGLAFQPKKKCEIIRKAGILERRDYFFNALKSSLSLSFTDKTKQRLRFID